MRDEDSPPLTWVANPANFPGLKIKYLIPPVVALILVGAWNGMLMRSISVLKEERVDLRKKIAAVSQTAGAGADFATAQRSSKAAGKNGKAPMDWEAVAGQMAGMANGDGLMEIRSMMELQQRLDGMSQDEMLAAMDEIAGLDISAEVRELLESMMIVPLIEADPEVVLRRFADRIRDESDGIAWQLSSAIQTWAKKDLTAATAWFEEQISAGTFDSKTLDGRSEMRLQFEGALMESLIGSDPEAAALRLAALPEDQRREVLQQIAFDELPEEARKAYTGLVRGLVPESEREGTFAHLATELVGDGGFESVGKFLDGVNAIPAERAAAAGDAANTRMEELGRKGQVTAEEVDAMRGWLDRQAPGKTDSITGKALAEAAQERGKFKYEDAAALALKYHQSSGNDDLLVGFLEGFYARSNLEQALKLAEQIKDENRRAVILEELK